MIPLPKDKSAYRTGMNSCQCPLKQFQTLGYFGFWIMT
jgi:hypothetical protein